VEEICPAVLTKNDQHKISETCLYLYEHLGCLGISRFDIRITSNGKIYFLENNTCPGLLNYEQSDIPKQLKAAGISMEEFVENQIINGLSRIDNKLEVRE
jgi:D-alanine-D-alanine ligase